MKYDNNLVTAIIECGVYIERVLWGHPYQIDTNLYLPPSLVASKMEALKLKVAAYIKLHSEHLTRMKKLFLATNLQTNVEPFPWFYGMIKIHKTPWAMRPIILFNGRLMHPIVIWTDISFQHMEADIPAYFHY